MSSETTWTSYDPNAVSIYRVLNEDYNTLSKVKLRLASADDPTITLQRGQHVDLAFGVDSKGRTCFKYGGKVVQQVDFNDGGSADDLTMPGFNSNNENSGLVLYNSGDLVGTVFEVVNFKTNQYSPSFSDLDGIDHGPLAFFRQKISEGKMILSITKI